jgi:acyl carrier protein
MNIPAELRQYLFETLLPTPRDSRPADDDDLFDLGLDSVRSLRLLGYIEEHFRVQLPEQEITPERIGTVSSLVALIEEHR